MTHLHEHSVNIKHNRAFAIGIVLNLIFIAVEIFYGLKANSSALLADAGHNTSDVLSLVFAWLAMWLASKKPGGKYTYGFRKTTILVSILNAFLLFAAMTAISWDAIAAIRNPRPVEGTLLMIVAGIGVLINTFTALLFIRGQKEDLNIKGAFLHMAADAAVSFGVVIAGLLIMLTGKQWIDPLMSFLIITVILLGTWRLFTDSIKLALDAVPDSIKLEKVKDLLLSQEGVEDIHDLHIWAMSTTQVALTAHLIMPGKHDDKFIAGLQKQLKLKFGIEHTTFQIENEFIEENRESNC